MCCPAISPAPWPLWDEIATLLGLPGKLGMHGSKVWQHYQDGDIAGIRAYCETDVLNTYLVYLRFELLRGRLQAAEYLRECQVAEYFVRRGQTALQGILASLGACYAAAQLPPPQPIPRIAMTRSRRRARPPEYFTVRVDALAHDGRGIARLDGKAVLIHGALPGEDVRFQRTARHAGYDEGAVVEVSNPAPDRVEPRCPHFGICGGCSLQYLEGGKQIAVKQAWLLDNLSRIGKVRSERILEPLLGPLWGYRRRARLGVKDVPKKGRVLVGFRERASTYLADLRRCEILDPRLGGLLEELTQVVESLSIRQRLPQIEAAVGDAALALNFRVLAAPNDEDKTRLAAFGQRHDIQIYLQSKGPETTALLWPEQGRLSYRLPAQHLELEFQPSHHPSQRRDQPADG